MNATLEKPAAAVGTTQDELKMSAQLVHDLNAALERNTVGANFTPSFKETAIPKIASVFTAYRRVLLQRVDADWQKWCKFVLSTTLDVGVSKEEIRKNVCAKWDELERKLAEQTEVNARLCRELAERNREG